ncbi:hypothetical protein Dsin_025807 [Dipteronia sinensis]|uniref:Uncharacterized protein n=1 Tax=Dipteronia sinensis TaxID=43782 RepID=A0AAD9ZWI7_9ROSI|nr:hypothetical protein Dsin_025807 [Dipteronia sinensis]
MRTPLVSKNLTKYISLDNPSEKANSAHSELDSATHDQDSSSMSDYESSISGPCNDLLPSFYDGLIRLLEGDIVLISLGDDWFWVWVWVWVWVCLKDSVVDEDGMRHLLLCRLILGKTDVVHPGSDQYRLSFEEFDSSVDN